MKTIQPSMKCIIDRWPVSRGGTLPGENCAMQFGHVISLLHCNQCEGQVLTIIVYYMFATVAAACNVSGYWVSPFN